MPWSPNSRKTGSCALGRQRMPGDDLTGELDAFLAEHSGELIEFRRDLHAHPEIGYHEHRTTRRVALRLAAGGLRPMFLPKGTGLIADVGSGVIGPVVSGAAGAGLDGAALFGAGAGAAAAGPVVALRADLDALPIPDEKSVPYRSTVPNACHACGHDVHTTILLGAGLFLARMAEAGRLPGRVRLIFQPAEEVPGGALDVLAAGGIAGVDRIFALHCDPRLDVGKVGIRTGPITAACDKITVRVGWCQAARVPAGAAAGGEPATQSDGVGEVAEPGRGGEREHQGEPQSQPPG